MKVRVQIHWILYRLNLQGYEQEPHHDMFPVGVTRKNLNRLNDYSFRNFLKPFNRENLEYFMQVKFPLHSFGAFALLNANNSNKTERSHATWNSKFERSCLQRLVVFQSVVFNYFTKRIHCPRLHSREQNMNETASYLHWKFSTMTSIDLMMLKTSQQTIRHRRLRKLEEAPPTVMKMAGRPKKILSTGIKLYISPKPRRRTSKQGWK